MAGRIVLFGATGYTGRLTAEAMVARGVRPVLAARHVERPRALGDELGGLGVALADLSTRVAMGYSFPGGGGGGGGGGGTGASAAGAMLEPVFAWRDGEIQTERAGKRIASFDVDGRRKQGISVGSSEHFTLPRLHPS